MTAMTADEIRDWADNFVGAIEQGDIDWVGRHYADEIRVWHNAEDAEQDKATNLEVLANLTRCLTDVRYVDRRVEVFDGGYVQQHTLTALAVDGTALSLPAALVVRLGGGLAVRIDEYLDSARAADFYRAFALVDG
ncbi:nuclear transport factor 2 family protein [Gordonia rhizosphera]|uniref:SnoaL-like domain-containing protein n=1 Tax=Gordonia rhizosphera NBRC 16068 TaxID=1108045 RepID=K6WM20_9ACTN|nr:hypothetical protein [Gordonia rhizosphera]GAB93197.1 hypothetical protein GORHZ_209_00320 [Gordonia rhizosphera NBRC 16068]